MKNNNSFYFCAVHLYVRVLVVVSLPQQSLRVYRQKKRALLAHLEEAQTQESMKEVA